MPESARQPLIDAALNNCASEPIHLIGKIQPVGVLLVIEKTQFVIHAASQNLSSIFALDAASALGRPLPELLGEEQTRRLKILTDVDRSFGAIIWSLTLTRDGKPRQYDAQVFASNALLVLEIEQAPRQIGDVFHDLFVPIRDALWKLDAETDMACYAQAVVDQVRVLTNFDRVMMYRFDNNWDGEVIAECKIDDASSYLGNHFPAADIPPQARDLYTKNLVRLIADVKSAPIPLIQVAGHNDSAPVDLTYSWLRAMSPVHVEYLGNMGVRASLSISLVQNNRLWGLIACHHFSPKYVGLRERELDELIGRTVSLKLMNMENVERSNLSSRIRDLLQDLTELIRRADEIESVFHTLKDKLLGLVRATGCIVSIGSKYQVLGEVPAAPVLERLMAKIRTLSAAPVFHTDQLGELLGDIRGLEEYDQDLAGGMMVAPLDPRMENYVIWFRPGLLRTLRWAGKPEKRVISDASGVRISPRTSFETWIETQGSKSQPWSQAEVDAANALTMALIEALSEKALKTSEEQYRILAENSTDMIASLDTEGRFRFVSPACREMLGQDSEHIVGRTLMDVLASEQEKILRLLDELKPVGATQTTVLRSKHGNDQTLWIETKFKHTQCGHGSSEIILNARDVTQRYNYQLAIESVHRRNARILDAAGEGLVSLDREGKVVYANELAQRLLDGYDNKLIGKFCCQVICATSGEHSCGQNTSECPFMNTLRDGETRQGRHAFLTSIGYHDKAAVNYVCTPLLENNQVVGCVVIFSESPLTGAAQDTGRATEVILDQAQEAVMVTDRDGRIASINRAFTEITGFTSEEAVGQTPRIIKSGVHTPHFYEEFWRHLREQGNWSGEIWNRRKNGEVYPQWGSVTVILDANGAVRNYVAVFSDVSKAKQAEDKLYFLANHDTLTGLPNRISFTDHLTRSLERAKRSDGMLAVAFIDLDNFKIVNDTLGHAVGDIYLKTIAERIQSCTRKQDTLARWGGDEFVLVMEDIKDRHQVGESIIRLLTQVARDIHLEGRELLPTASIGISLYPDDGRLPADLIKAADAAMYLAKKGGRNRFVFFAESMNADLDIKLTMSSELRHALNEKQFFLVYQPQVDPTLGTIKGVEALIRWQHPTRGVIPPADFLPLADELGLLEEIGTWVLGAACRQMRNWLDHDASVPRVAVNVAPCQLNDGFVDTVRTALEQTGISARRLEIEITEGSLESGALAQKITADLRDLGVMLSVDDFGTGYSSLSHIKMFPITCFKIDKSFIDGVPENSDDVAIVRTILALGSSFKVEVVAEGVETLQQVEFLRSEGVSIIQGYYFSRPLPADRIQSLSPADFGIASR